MRLCEWLPRRRLVIALGLAMALVTGAEPAAGYEFELTARTIGQGSSLRSLRFTVPDLRLSRRRFTQTLSLNIWDIGGRLGVRRPWDRLSRGPDVSFTSYLRIDHDFGSWASGSLVVGDRIHDAVDLVPELETELLDLELLYAYVSAENLAGGLVDVYAGRLLDIDTLDWWSMDGIKLRVEPRLPVAVEGFLGLRVRDASPLGAAVTEPDGTSSGGCTEYVEGEVPGSGAWRPIDRQVLIDNDRFRNDYDVCPQREEPMPTFGGAIEVRGPADVWARLAYRRSVSTTPGLIGPVDRFEYADTGLYPNELGQAPGWGVNEERLAASVRSRHELGGGQLMPYGAVRYNFLLAAVDEGHVGARLRYGAHAIEPEVYYSLPSFDGDSIFNVFSIQPFTDVRLTYDLAPRRSRLGGYVRGWVKRFGREDEPTEGGDPGAELGPDTSGGVQLGGRYVERRRLAARMDLFHDRGYGGTRTGGFATAAWQATRATGLRARLSVIHFEEDLREDLRGVTVGVQAGATYVINDGVALHLMAEDNAGWTDTHWFRLIGVIDLAFTPET